MFDGTAILAGGSVLNYLFKGFNEFNVDYDIFFVNTDPESIIRKITNLILITGSTVCRTNNSITLCDCNIQFIFRIYSDIEEVLTGFDLDSSQVGFDGQNFYMTPRAEYSLINRTLFIDFDRLINYSRSKLFSVYVPELSLNKGDLLNLQLYIPSTEQNCGLTTLLSWFIFNLSPKKCSDYNDPGYPIFIINRAENIHSPFPIGYSESFSIWDCLLFQPIILMKIKHYYYLLLLLKHLIMDYIIILIHILIWDIQFQMLLNLHIIIFMKVV